MTDAVGTRSAAWLHAVAAWAVARVCVALAFLGADLVADHLDASARGRLHLDQGLLTWDGSFYWSIAHHGYAGSPDDAIRFFPLYPLLGRVLGWPIGGHEAFPLLVVANAAALAGLVLLYRLVEEELHDPGLAARSVWVLALFPAAGILAFGYSEGLALALSLAALLWARRERWWWASAAALGVGLTRPVGVLLVLPLAAEAWRQRASLRAAGTRRLAPAALTMAAPAVGLLAYLVWVEAAVGDWTRPLDEQRRLRGGFRDPVTRLWDAVDTTLTTSRVEVFNLAFAAVLVVLAVIAVRRLPWGWSSYAVASLVVALSAENITSVGRYGLVAFPFAVAGGQLCRRREVELAWVATSAAAMVAFTLLTLVGGQVP